MLIWILFIFGGAKPLQHRVVQDSRFDIETKSSIAAQTLALKRTDEEHATTSSTLDLAYQCDCIRVKFASLDAFSSTERRSQRDRFQNEVSSRCTTSAYHPSIQLQFVVSC